MVYGINECNVVIIIILLNKKALLLQPSTTTTTTTLIESEPSENCVRLWCYEIKNASTAKRVTLGAAVGEGKKLKISEFRSCLSYKSFFFLSIVII